MEIKYCQDCKIYRILETSQQRIERGIEFDALHKELARMRDDGMSYIDCAIHFKNMLWRMLEEDVSCDSPKRTALESVIAAMDAAVAQEKYEAAGWHLKHSGEWIKK